MPVCYTCQEVYEGDAEAYLHIYRHLQEMWPDRDYSAKIKLYEERIADGHR